MQGKKTDFTEDELTGMYLELARDYYINMYYDTATIANKLKVSQRIVQIWAKDGNWKMIKDSRKSLPSTQMQIVMNLYSQMLDESSKPVDEIRYDLLSKHNKIIRELEFVRVDALQMQTIAKDFIIFLYETKRDNFIKIAFRFLEEFQLWRKDYKK